MKRAVWIALGLVVLVVTALAIWIMTREKAVQPELPVVIEQPTAVPEPEGIAEPVRPVLELRERAAYRLPSGARIWGVLRNIDNFSGPGLVEARIYFAGKEVANSSLFVNEIEPGQEREFELIVRYDGEWNAFNITVVGGRSEGLRK